MFKMLKDILI